MNKDQITESIKQIFSNSDKRVVFWYDPERSFDAEVDELDLTGVIKWRLDEHGPSTMPHHDLTTETWAYLKDPLCLFRPC